MEEKNTFQKIYDVIRQIPAGKGKEPGGKGADCGRDGGFKR